MAELTDEAKQAIADAVAILKSDGVHIHKTYAEFQRTLSGDGKEGDQKGKAKTGEGDPPPKKDVPADPPKKRGIWWAERED